MPALTITSDAIQVHVDFNGYEPSTGFHNTSFKRSHISIVNLVDSDRHVEVYMLNGDEYDISYTDTDGALTVASIDGVQPVSNADLKNKINALVL